MNRGQAWVCFIVLSVAGGLAGYAIDNLMPYLTDVWKLRVPRAAAIVNFQEGLTGILTIAVTFTIDACIDISRMLLFSSFAYSVGLLLLWLSVPSVLPSGVQDCDLPDVNKCMGNNIQTILFYNAMVFVTIGMSGYKTAFILFFTGEDIQIRFKKHKFRIDWLDMLLCLIPFIIISFIFEYNIFEYNIAKIFEASTVALGIRCILFCFACFTHKPSKPTGSPLTRVTRVFVAAALKRHLDTPTDDTELYEKEIPLNVERVDPPADDSTQPYEDRISKNVDEIEDLPTNDTQPYEEERPPRVDQHLPRTRGFRCLEKAAIVLPSPPSREEQIRNKWTLCTKTQVEEAKIFFRMIPVLLTFIICGLVLSIGSSYFLDQINNSKIPYPLWLLLIQLSKFGAKLCYKGLKLIKNKKCEKYVPPFGIGIGMVISILCCITAASVEKRRIIRESKTDEGPMFRLFPQFILFGLFKGMLSSGIRDFYEKQVPATMQGYVSSFIEAVTAAGTALSVPFTIVLGKISESGGNPNWFGDTLRLDKYYWTLAATSAINLGFFICTSMCYKYK